jgi:hypothetical protein
MSLGQTYVDRLRFSRGSRAAAQPSLIGAGTLGFPDLAQAQFEAEPTPASTEIAGITAD